MTASILFHSLDVDIYCLLIAVCRLDVERRLQGRRFYCVNQQLYCDNDYNVRLCSVYRLTWFIAAVHTIRYDRGV